MSVLDDDWGDFASVEAPEKSTHQYPKGAAVLYKTREGNWVPGKVREKSFCRRRLLNNIFFAL